MRIDSALAVRKGAQACSRWNETRSQQLCHLIIVILSVSRNEVFRMNSGAFIKSPVKSRRLLLRKRGEFRHQHSGVHAEPTNASLDVRVTTVSEKNSFGG